jgi:hypothetical protein
VTLTPLPFHPDDEIIEEGEEETFRRLASVMDFGTHHARDADRSHGRRSHAKCLGALRGELRVSPDLPPELAQGLFGSPGGYDVVARLSHLPAERLDDRMVSSVRGLALRVFGVKGEPLPDHEGGFQDFVLDTGKSFNVRKPATLLAGMGAVEATGPLPQGFKAAVSHAARAVNSALDKVGLFSDNLDVLGHKPRHPLTESYYSQAPLRWGRFVAKFGMIPVATGAVRPIEIDGPDALRSAVQSWCAANELRFTVAAQLRVDAEEMPIEDAHKEWPEELSAYRAVGEVVFAPQDALDADREELVNNSAFSPWKGIEDHRPLGGIMRARRYVYRHLSEQRFREMEAAGTGHDRVP